MPGWLRTIIRAQNPFMVWMLRSPLHRFVSSLYLLLIFSGRKSGKRYTVPVQYGQDGQRLYIITSEGYTWWKNLRGGAEIQVHLRGRTLHAHAETSSDPQAIRAMVQHVYPRLPEARRDSFVQGKIGITITLNE